MSRWAFFVFHVSHDVAVCGEVNVVSGKRRRKTATWANVAGQVRKGPFTCAPDRAPMAENSRIRRGSVVWERGDGVEEYFDSEIWAGARRGGEPSDSVADVGVEDGGNGQVRKCRAGTDESRIREHHSGHHFAEASVFFRSWRMKNAASVCIINTCDAIESTPDRIRTCNPRFRRPMRYPIAPRTLHRVLFRRTTGSPKGRPVHSGSKRPPSV